MTNSDNDTDRDERLIAAHRDVLYKAPEHRVAQWHAAIDSAAALERGRQSSTAPKRSWFSFGWAFGAAATLALGIAIGVLVTSQPTVPTTQVVETVEQPSVVPAAFTRGLQYHIRESREQLIDSELSSDTTGLVLDIIEQNRLFESAAENNNAHNLARLLRAFEPILLQLAADDIAPEDAEALREQLAFELHVMLTKLERESSDRAETT